jgi:hypothetical protein
VSGAFDVVGDINNSSFQEVVLYQWQHQLETEILLIQLIICTAAIVFKLYLLRLLN